MGLWSELVPSSREDWLFVVFLLALGAGWLLYKYIAARREKQRSAALVREWGATMSLMIVGLGGTSQNRMAGYIQHATERVATNMEHGGDPANVISAEGDNFIRALGGQPSLPN